MNDCRKNILFWLTGYIWHYITKGTTCTLLHLLLIFFFGSCSLHNQISKQAAKNILSDSALLPAHVAISLFEPASGKYWYNYQADKYCIPASNTKLFSLYAGLKYLGDSLVAVRYTHLNDTLFIMPAGDPTFLYRDFKIQKLFEFLKASGEPVVIIKNNKHENAWGPGWSWDDYNDDYMAERSPMPVYGNTVRWIQLREKGDEAGKEHYTIFSEPRLKGDVTFTNDTTQKGFFVKRDFAANNFHVTPGTGENGEQQTPFITNGIESLITFLKDTLPVNVTASSAVINKKFCVFYSQPSDSLFKIMMYRSDNFFAEQTLLMASNEKLGYMNDKKIIDTILNADLQDIPQKPVWVDGSGLSRYNLFTPKDFVYILNKMKNDFGFERLKNILPTGGTGTLQHYYRQDSGFIYAKTGTLSNDAALSGFLITQKNRLLIFSILANNFVTEAMPFRKAVEKFLTGIRHRY